LADGPDRQGVSDIHAGESVVNTHTLVFLVIGFIIGYAMAPLVLELVIWMVERRERRSESKRDTDDKTGWKGY
jgi:hypothetical protein